MTLEEKLTFYSREDAADFQKYLRENDCASRISVEQVFSGEPCLEGTIENFSRLFSRIIEDNEKEGDIDADLIKMKEDLIIRKGDLEEFLASHKVGDIIVDSTPSQMLAQLQSIDVTGDDAIRKQAADKFVSSLMILATLEDNGLLESRESSASGTEDGEAESENIEEDYVLSGIKPAGEMTIIYPYSDFNTLIPDLLDEFDIISHIRASATTNYVVTTDASIVLLDSDELANYLDNVDVDEEESSKFIDAVFFKQVFVSKIREIINLGKTSEADIFEMFNAPSFPLEGTNDVISFDITQEYLKAAIADLKKLGLISGKDGKIKNC